MAPELPEPRQPGDELPLPPLPGIETADLDSSEEHIWTAEEVTTVARRQIFEYGRWLLPSHVDRAYNRPGKIEIAFDVTLYGRPALTELTDSGRLRLHFDQDTLDSYMYDHLSGVSEDAAMRLYVGCGLISHMILRRLSLPSLTDTNLSGINAFLKEPFEVGGTYIDNFQRSIKRASADFTPQERAELDQVLIAYNNVDNERRSYANMLRFAMSVMLTPNESWYSDDPAAPSAEQSQVTSATRSKLKNFLSQLDRRALSIRDLSLAATQGLPEPDCEKWRPDIFEVRKKLLENISEFEMAAAFPMGLAEMKRVASYCR